MGYSRHLSMDEIERIWNKEKDSPYGVWISDDLLINGRFLKTELDYHGIDFNDIDWDSEYIEFSEDSYYIVKNLVNGMYDSIHEISCMDDLAYYYYD